jgi:hypothetical protein
MKKMFSYLLAVIFAFALSVSYGQGGFVPVYVTPTTSAYFTVNVPANSLVYVQSTDRFYNVLVACGRTVNMDWVLANGNRYDDASVTSLGGYGYTYFVDTATAQNVYGIKSFKANMYFKDQLISQPHVNAIQFGNSVKATDTLFGAGASVSGNVSVGGFLTATDYIGLSGVWLLDNSTPGEFQYVNHGVWADFALIDTIGVKSKIKLMNLSDINIQNKAGTGAVEIIERDTTGSVALANVRNIRLIQQTGTDTAGIGSTATIGTIMYFNGHFYGLKAGTPPTWTQLDN